MGGGERGGVEEGRRRRKRGGGRRTEEGRREVRGVEERGRKEPRRGGGGEGRGGRAQGRGEEGGEGGKRGGVRLEGRGAGAEPAPSGPDLAPRPLSPGSVPRLLFWDRGGPGTGGPAPRAGVSPGRSEGEPLLGGLAFLPFSRGVVAPSGLGNKGLTPAPFPNLLMAFDFSSFYHEKPLKCV